MKAYTAATTALVASFIGFDAMWCMTKLDAIECFYMAMMIGFFAAGAYLLLTDRKPSRRNRPTFVRDEQTNLEFMPMKNGRVA